MLLPVGAFIGRHPGFNVNLSIGLYEGRMVLFPVRETIRNGETGGEFKERCCTSGVPMYN